MCLLLYQRIIKTLLEATCKSCDYHLTMFTLGSLVMGETPVALGCFLRTNLCFIFEEMAGQGREPLVLQKEREDVKDIVMATDK